jgi:hypothetical protein
MLIHKICRNYSHLLEMGKTYAAAEFSAVIQETTNRALKTLQNSPLFFRRSENGGIILDSIYFE